MPEQSLAQYHAEDLKKVALKEIGRWLNVAGTVKDEHIISTITGIVSLYLQGYKQIMK